MQSASATPARRLRKISTAISAEAAPPRRGSTPSIALTPSHAREMLPMLNTTPPTKPGAASTWRTPQQGVADLVGAPSRRRR